MTVGGKSTRIRPRTISCRVVATVFPSEALGAPEPHAAAFHRPFTVRGVQPGEVRPRPTGLPEPLPDRALASYVRCVYTGFMPKIKERWDFRVASETDQLVRQAAEASDRTLTDFVVDAAVVEAERVLADRTRFVLDAERWNLFVELLDRPPQDKPGLEKLFSKPSVFTTE